MGKFGTRCQSVLKIFLDKITHLRIIRSSGKYDHMESNVGRHSPLFVMGMPVLFLGNVRKEKK